jgi:hypothetical protein
MHQMRRVLAAPLMVVSDVVYEWALLLDMLHGAVSGEGFE